MLALGSTDINPTPVSHWNRLVAQSYESESFYEDEYEDDSFLRV